MGRATECKYIENYRRLKEQLINGVDDEVMTAEIKTNSDERYQ